MTLEPVPACPSRFEVLSGGGKAMNVGKAKVKNQADEGRKATFKDVAGADEEKEELEEIVAFLKNQQVLPQTQHRALA